MDPKDPIEKLRAAGVPVDKMSEDQRKALEGLSEEEISALVRIQEKLSGDVQGYVRSDDTGIIIF
jgi:hypothetical protein